MTTRRAGLTTGFLGVACCALATVVALELNADGWLAPEVTAAPSAPPPVPEAEPLTFTPPPPDAFVEIALRPLFSASRRPFVPEEEPAEETPVDEVEISPLVVDLIGVLLAGERRSALLQPQGDGAAQWLREGETIKGWMLRSVERDHITLSRGVDEVQILDLRRD